MFTCDVPIDQIQQLLQALSHEHFSILDKLLRDLLFSLSLDKNSGFCDLLKLFFAQIHNFKYIFSIFKYYQYLINAMIREIYTIC